MSFEGFNEEINTFFINLKENNNKEWFSENKKWYQANVKNTAKKFVESAGSEFFSLGLPYIADTKKSLFRINRDIRFTKDKSPYKTHLGVYFPYGAAQTEKKPVNSLGLYFHFEPGLYFAAGGLHSPEPNALKAIRKKLDKDYESFSYILNNEEFSEFFPDGLKGEQLKTAPKGYDTGHPAIEFLRYKQFFVDHPLKKEDTFNEHLLEIIVKTGVILAPMLDYFQDATDNYQIKT